MTTLSNRFSILCYDGDGGDGGDGGDAAAKAAAAAAAAAGGGGGDDKRFTQAEVNKFVADDKRKHQERYAQLEVEHRELLNNQNLTTEERDTLQTRLDDLAAANRTKEQQAEFDRKKSEQKANEALEQANKRGDHWEQLFKTTEVRRALQDAAIGADAFNPGHIVALLQSDTELKDVEGALTPMVDFVDIDEKTGKEIRTLRTPADAVKRMRELPKVHGNLFKSNVVSGVGAGQGASADADNIDYANMTSEEYRANRDKIKARMARN